MAPKNDEEEEEEEEEEKEEEEEEEKEEEEERMNSGRILMFRREKRGRGGSYLSMMKIMIERRQILETHSLLWAFDDYDMIQCFKILRASVIMSERTRK